MNKQKILVNLPNCCTLLNALCGCVALLISVFYQEPNIIKIACFLIVVGGFFDGIDGKLARRYQVSSLIGKELDSFSDLITFVIAPVCVFLAMHSMVRGLRVNGIEIVIIVFYILCGVYRLARYNVTDISGYFEGMPTTMAGGLMSIYIFVSNMHIERWAGNMVYTLISYGFIALLGMAMISRVKVNRI